MTDIGTIIKDQLRQQGLSVSQLAKQLRMSHTQLYYNLKQNNLTIGRLDEISKALNHNFFSYLAGGSGDMGAAPDNLTSENTRLKEENGKLKEEVGFLKNVIGALTGKGQ